MGNGSSMIQPNDHSNNNNNNGGEKGSGSITVVLKIRMDCCEDCRKKTKECILSFEGVKSVKFDENDSNKVRVTGNVDPVKLKEELAQRRKKKVELICPLPPKKADKGSGGGERSKEQTKDSKRARDEKKSNEKKNKNDQNNNNNNNNNGGEKGSGSITVVLKIRPKHCECEGCRDSTKKWILRTFNGVKSVKFNENDPEELWVTGKVDPEELRKKLEQKMTKRKVELIISPLKPKKVGKSKGGSGGGGGERKNQEKAAKEQKKLKEGLIGADHKEEANAIKTLDKLNETHKTLKEKEKVLVEKATAEVEGAKEFMKAKNKKAAIQCLKRKKLYEQQIEQLGNYQFRIHEQIIMLEGAKATAETVDALRTGAAALKAIQKAMNIDDVDKTMGEINEQPEIMKQIQKALSAPIGAAADFDEDELEAELEKLLQPATTAPAASVNVRAGRQQTRPAPRKNTAEC